MLQCYYFAWAFCLCYFYAFSNYGLQSSISCFKSVISIWWQVNNMPHFGQQRMMAMMGRKELSLLRMLMSSSSTSSSFVLPCCAGGVIPGQGCGAGRRIWSPGSAAAALPNCQATSSPPHTAAKWLWYQNPKMVSPSFPLDPVLPCQIVTEAFLRRLDLLWWMNL